MANDINSVILVGRLTRDAEMRYTNSGMAICKFSVAVNRRKRSGDQWTDEVNFFDITLFGKSAEGVHQYLVKGKQVAIQGELRQNRWEQDGQTRSKVEIVAQNLELLGGGGSSPSGGGSVRQGTKPFEQYNSGPGPEDFDDDIPF
ncbi:single-stranded DNA-binding protein [Sediminispirochaeta smaragdinae]|jgi:single-strand DNA-binding protein|uniref:Single-stranded DNA-binding protein n=1 Tax=Sediminispirochaeta smaragdinae (strain DSM 11293 / JCM 15392 / SEBR 4228) TaxID=573413 RepID=E1R296_SEDSS|nr:single-stranded DNA-binding protein [Sediminispirochaeta smaragdinae]ADK81981.1 single-strand binding protein [Sediminispirochaeta smaragdinae DSM 11293]